jgi:hypothetical protein
VFGAGAGAGAESGTAVRAGTKRMGRLDAWLISSKTSTRPSAR